MSARFVHLHLHSEYSLADSTIRIPELVARCVAHGQPSVAITDRNNLFALVKFYKAAEAAGIKPIAGADIWLADGDEAPWQLTLLCRDRAGYLALSRLLSRAWLEGQRHDGVMVRPTWLHEEHDGPVRDRRPPQPRRPPRLGRAPRTRRAMAGRLAAMSSATACISKSRAAGWPAKPRSTNTRCTRLSTLAIPLVASNDVRFLDASDFEAHEARVCIASGRVLDDPKRPRDYSDQQYLKSARRNGGAVRRHPRRDRQHAARWRSAATSNLTLGKTYLPAFPVPSDHTLESWIRSEARDGLEERLQKHPLAPGHDRARLRQAAGNGTRSHHRDGVPGLLPDRRGLHQLGQGPRHPGRSGPRFRRRFAGRLGARHHRSRSDPVRPAVRALPQSRTRVDARLRHRLLHGSPRRGDRLCRRQVRPRPRQPDHHLRHDGGEGGGARRRPRARLSVRLRRRHRQAHSADARHLPRRCARHVGGRAQEPQLASRRTHRALSATRTTSATCSTLALQARRPDPQRRQARRRRRHRAIAADATSARCSPNTTATASVATRSRSSTRTTSKRSAWSSSTSSACAR